MPPSIYKPLHFLVTIEAFQRAAALWVHWRFCFAMYQAGPTNEKRITFCAIYYGLSWFLMNNLRSCLTIIISHFSIAFFRWFLYTPIIFIFFMFSNILIFRLHLFFCLFLYRCFKITPIIFIIFNNFGRFRKNIIFFIFNL